jgi:hypothetical protein
MADIFLSLGAAVVRTACKIWLKDNAFAADASTTVVNAIEARVSGARDRRRLNRLFEDLEETVADKVLAILDHEFGGLPENDRNAAIIAAEDVFARAGLKEQDLFAADLDPMYLEKQVRSGDTRLTRDLSQGSAVLYQYIVTECCVYIVEMASALPRFQAGSFAEILRRESVLVGMVQELLNRIPARAAGSDVDGDDLAFQTSYCRQMVNKLDRLELFGATLNTRRYPLSVAYISLQVRESWRVATARAIRTAFDELLMKKDLSVAAGVKRIEDVLPSTRRLLVEGPAGSGKTTLLQWLAVRSARADFSGDLASWNGTVPFFVPLRRYVGRPLPEPDDLARHVGRYLADQMPEGWARRQLVTGRAMILIDGLDEFPEKQRFSVFNWLRALWEDYPGVLTIVTSRPGVVELEWANLVEMTVAALQPMSPPDVTTFIRQWHQAVRSDTPDQEERDRIDRYEKNLQRAIVAQRHLRSLATTPLLCALICALHGDRRMQLPRDRMDVYEAALDMLLERRDLERGIDADGVRLSRREKTLLLEGLAYWMVRNDLSEAAQDRAVQQVGRTLDLLHHVGDDPAKVFSHLLSRSGLLQETSPGHVVFIHRTFEEYLAARAIVSTDDLGVLVQHAHQDQWHNIVVMAAWVAGAAVRERLLVQLLQASDEHAGRRRPLSVVTLACLDNSPELPAGLRAEIEARARRLMPPRSSSDVVALASGGEMVVDLLAECDLRTPQEFVATIKVAALIGGANALRLIARAGRLETSAVEEELLNAWPRFEPTEFARQVLAGSRHCTSLTVTDASLMPGLRHLGQIEWLTCVLPEGYGDLGFLGELNELIGLHIREDRKLRDFSPVRHCPSLRTLFIDRVAEVNLADLPVDSQIVALGLFGDKVSDLHRLRQWHRVRNLALGRCAERTPLPELLPPVALKRLALHGWRGLSDLTALIRLSQLSEVVDLTLRGCVDLRSVDGVGRWADSLRELTISGCPQVDIGPIARLPNLRLLDLSGNGEIDVSPLAGLPGLRIRLDETQKVTGEDRLAEGASIDRTIPHEGR